MQLAFDVASPVIGPCYRLVVADLFWLTGSYCGVLFVSRQFETQSVSIVPVERLPVCFAIAW